VTLKFYIFVSVFYTCRNLKFAAHCGTSKGPRLTEYVSLLTRCSTQKTGKFIVERKKQCNASFVVSMKRVTLSLHLPVFCKLAPPCQPKIIKNTHKIMRTSLTPFSPLTTSYIFFESLILFCCGSFDFFTRIRRKLEDHHKYC
jgi:hypothetical protein